MGNVTAEKGFDGAVRHYLRDRGGRVVRETLPSGTEREYGYDACSRVTRVSYPTAGDPDQTYAYGLSGRLVQASRGESTVEFAYNSLGLPVRETADGNTILRTYDHTGRILTLDSTTGASLRYTSKPSVSWRCEDSHEPAPSASLPPVAVNPSSSP